jgi:hypothetical protein
MGNKVKKVFFWRQQSIVAMLNEIRSAMVELLPVLRPAILRPSRGTIFIHNSHCRQALQAEVIT